nr:MAG TPA_asm: hypothetical protein [Caudoviricetes sp.]
MRADNKARRREIIKELRQYKKAITKQLEEIRGIIRELHFSKIQSERAIMKPPQHNATVEIFRLETLIKLSNMQIENLTAQAETLFKQREELRRAIYKVREGLI